MRATHHDAHRSDCDNTRMNRDEDPTPEIYPIAYSTAYLCLAALLTIRANDDDHFDATATRYAAEILELVKHQPETVLSLPPSELEETGPSILANARAWLN